MSEERDALLNLYCNARYLPEFETRKGEDYLTVVEALEQKEKLEKAFKILKKTYVMRLIKLSDDYDDFVYNCCEDLSISKEEFNLLKEMLNETK